jgi:hypothetical protein
MLRISIVLLVIGTIGFSFCPVVGCRKAAIKKAEGRKADNEIGIENRPLGKCIISGMHYTPEKGNEGVLCSVDLETGRVDFLGPFGDTRTFVQAVAVDPEWRTMVTGNYCWSSSRNCYEKYVKVHELGGPNPVLIFEREVERDTDFTVIYDESEGVFYVTCAAPNGWSFFPDRGFAKEFERGKTAVFRYDPVKGNLENYGRIDYYARLLPGTFGDEITVIYSPYPETYAMGFFDKVAREFYAPSGYGRLIPSNCMWFNDPESMGSFGYEREVYPTHYYFFDNTRTPWGYVVYLFFNKKGHGGDFVKLGDSVWPPILYSSRNGTLVYLSTFPKSPTVSSRGLRITVKFLDDGTERSYALPPSPALEEFLLRPFALLYVD